MNKKEDYVYIVLIKALTGLGKLSRTINKYEYTHIAVALEAQMQDFITFSRRLHYAPFNAGFMHEKVEHYAFGNNKKVKVKVFKVPVANMKKIESFIHTIESDKEYIFNIYSMITMPFLHGFRIYKSYNCMSFTGKIIELTGRVNLNKRYYKYTIEEMDHLLTQYFYIETEIEKTRNDEAYMKKPEFFANLKSFAKLNLKLIYRLLFKRNKGYEEFT